MSETLKPDTFHDDFYDCESTTNACELTDAFRANEKVDGRSIVIDCADEQADEDTREKLEADVWAGCDHLTMAERGDVLVNVPLSRLLGWLDRQAAITEREGREYENALREQHHKRIAELRAEFDKLREKYNDLRHLQSDYNDLNKLAAGRLAGWSRANEGWALANAEAEKWRQKYHELRTGLKHE